MNSREAKVVVNQCYRYSPVGITAFWIPNKETIDQLEGRLLPALQRANLITVVENFNKFAFQ
jgi:hypothetical protein